MLLLSSHILGIRWIKNPSCLFPSNTGIFVYKSYDLSTNFLVLFLQYFTKQKPTIKQDTNKKIKERERENKKLKKKKGQVFFFLSVLPGKVTVKSLLILTSEDYVITIW